MTGRILAVTLFIIALLSFPALSGSPEDKSVKYAEITASNIVILKEVDPKSEAVISALRGETFEITGEGKLWVRVKTKNGEGWVPVSECRVVDRKTTSLLSNPGSTIAFVGIIAVGLVISVVFIMRRKEDEEAF